MKDFAKNIFRWFLSLFKRQKKSPETNLPDSFDVSAVSEIVKIVTKEVEVEKEEPVIAREETSEITELIEEVASKSRSQILAQDIMTKYIAKRTLELDEATGLEKEVRATNIIIDAENEKISIMLKECLVSPTGVVMKVLKETQYERYNTVDNKRYDNLEESEVGQGIKQMVTADLQNYPSIGE